MGFEPQIRQIVENLPQTRQTLFFTATWPIEVRDLAKEFLTNPIEVKIGDLNVLNANKSITQNLIFVKPYEKETKLMEILENDILKSGNRRNIPKTIIFVNRKTQCDDLAYKLNGDGYAAKALHGDISQDSRSRTIDQLRNGNLRVIVATDVAARGLDIKVNKLTVNIILSIMDLRLGKMVNKYCRIFNISFI